MKKERLCDKKCRACSSGATPMSIEEEKALLEELGGGWKIVDGKKLEKGHKFPNFKEALDFVNKIGALAEEEGHHPDLELGWGYVRIYLWTHKIGSLSESDFILAAKCDKIS